MAMLEARVAAMEARQADYAAVLAAVNALGANQSEMALGQRELTRTVHGLVRTVDGHTAQLRSLEEGVAEIKDLFGPGTRQIAGRPLPYACFRLSG